MRVLMLGWEFPPFISGGLGTACLGLTQALSRAGVRVMFVLPRAAPGHTDPHAQLLAPHDHTPHDHPAGVTASASTPRLGVTASAVSVHPTPAPIKPGPSGPDSVPTPTTRTPTTRAHLQPPPHGGISFFTVPGLMASPYRSASGSLHAHALAPVVGPTPRPVPDAPHHLLHALAPISHLHPAAPAAPSRPGSSQTPAPDPANHHDPLYHGDLLAEAQRYARFCIRLAYRESFDVIHAHDWLTFPAGLAVAAVTAKPLIVHVHSTEIDRAGEHFHQPVYDIERRGMLGAMAVIAVSHLTRSVIQNRYQIHPDKIHVIYHGSPEPQPPAPTGVTASAITDPPPAPAIQRSDRVVLFLGRMTFQKGPEYFVRAARKVLDKIPNTKFVMAGTGDLVRSVIDLAAQQGIGQRVLFTGFLQPDDVERVFHMADVFVMPSVSEPFGLASLEAIRHDVPVIISKTTGVSEVLRHALKVDFWDIDELANKIVAVLNHPPLSSTLRQAADIEARRLTWDDTAAHCIALYQHALSKIPS